MAEIRFPAEVRDFSLPHRVQTSSWAHPAFYPAGIGHPFPGMKRSGREAHQSDLSRAEAKKSGDIPPLPHMPSWRDT
jgi:hypothetical protein